ncbi:flagellar hook-associated protein 3 [Massilia arenosa]|uniref:Flagellar hook-associated protein 3 n=1 Tax=Zemynaea arenosa TaxID=2561931 RepID=A0A4Y9STZ0_9BURK|nr:flagellar hook-associated protein FlgL [Massilia arenosa]TFW29908.1 flagellar hook-associated protein 3 [Massilia arenosa]
MTTLRISTRSIFESGTGQLGTLQSQIAKTQMQLSTGRKMITPSDDPIASARALEVTQSQSINTQLSTNRDNAKSSLSQVELALQNTTALIQDVQTLVVNAGNGALSQADRESIATELEGRLQDMLGVANTADGAGGYLFSGFKATTLPFTQTTTGAQYNGDQGQRELQVGSSRKVPISDSGSSVFENNKTGNGTFQTAADPGNLTRGGTGIISSGAVADASMINGHSYQIDFQVTGGTTTYTVTDTFDGTVLTATPQAYESGKQITVGGMAFDIKGAPADLDSFTVVPSQKESIFTTLTNLLNTLRSPGTGPAEQAALTNRLNQANDNLNNSLDNVLSVRASIGARLKEIDYLDSTGDDLNVQYEATLNDLQALDNVAAISLFTQQQFTLEAAQKSFKTLSGLSLFNFIG